MEADFQREYRIDLRRELRTMSWRRFCVLLGQVSKDSRLVLSVGQTKKILDGKAGMMAFRNWGK